MEGLEVALVPHFSGKDLVTWPQLAVGVAEKCALMSALEERGNGFGWKAARHCSSVPSTTDTDPSSTHHTHTLQPQDCNHGPCGQSSTSKATLPSLPGLGMAPLTYTHTHTQMEKGKITTTITSTQKRDVSLAYGSDRVFLGSTGTTYALAERHIPP